MPKSFFYIIGLPKSGTTWLHFLISDILDLVPVHPSVMSKYRDKGVYKFHQDIDNIRKNWIYGNTYSVYIVRDIRDVVVSFFHYYNNEYAEYQFKKYAKEMKKYNTINPFYFDYFIPNFIEKYKWDSHIKKYITSGLPIVKYSDLWNDPVRILIQLFSAWEITVNIDKVKQAVQKNSLDYLKNSDKRNRKIDGLRTLSSSFFRKGGTGNFINEIDDSILKDIEQRVPMNSVLFDGLNHKDVFNNLINEAIKFLDGNHLSKAKRLLKNSIFYDISSAIPWLYLGKIAQLHGGFSNAALYYKKAILLDPNFNLANQALDSIPIQYHIHPSILHLNEADFYKNEAKKLLQINDIDGATSHFIKALDVDPSDTEPVIQLCNIYIKSGKIESAKKILSFAIKLYPNHKQIVHLYNSLKTLPPFRAG